MNHPFEHEMHTAQKLARIAGEMAKSMKAGSIFIQKQNGEGPVSEADLKADLIITNGLKEQFPNDLVISEETATADTFLPSEGRVWLIDPIDGTSDYVKGGLDYSVMIGLLIDGTPALGIVFGPETDELWTGVLWKEGGLSRFFASRDYSSDLPVALNLRNCAPKSHPVVTVSKYHPSKIADQIVTSLSPSQIIQKGSLGLKLAMIADGKADFYVAASHRIKVWDTCAPAAILRAAGGFIGTFDGNELVYGPSCTHSTPFFAASFSYADLALKKLKQFIA